MGAHQEDSGQEDCEGFVDSDKDLLMALLRECSSHMQRFMMEIIMAKASMGHGFVGTDMQNKKASMSLVESYYYVETGARDKKNKTKTVVRGFECAQVARILGVLWEPGGQLSQVSICQIFLPAVSWMIPALASAIHTLHISPKASPFLHRLLPTSMQVSGPHPAQRPDSCFLESRRAFIASRRRSRVWPQPWLGDWGKWRRGLPVASRQKAFFESGVQD